MESLNQTKAKSQNRLSPDLIPTPWEQLISKASMSIRNMDEQALQNTTDSNGGSEVAFGPRCSYSSMGHLENDETSICSEECNESNCNDCCPDTECTSSCRMVVCENSISCTNGGNCLTLPCTEIGCSNDVSECADDLCLMNDKGKRRMLSPSSDTVRRGLYYDRCAENLNCLGSEPAMSPVPELGNGFLRVDASAPLPMSKAHDAVVRHLQMYHTPAISGYYQDHPEAIPEPTIGPIHMSFPDTMCKEYLLSVKTMSMTLDDFGQSKSFQTIIYQDGNAKTRLINATPEPSLVNSELSSPFESSGLLKRRKYSSDSAVHIEHHDPSHGSDFQASNVDLTLCRWAQAGFHCETAMPSWNALECHVLEAHIQPQALLPCQWDDCAEAINENAILSHVKHKHSPNASQHVCLWKGCDASFADSADLDQHLKSAHALDGRLQCHWDECTATVEDTAQLSRHFQVDHLCVDPKQTLSNGTPLAFSAPFETLPASHDSMDEPFSDSFHNNEKQLLENSMPLAGRDTGLGAQAADIRYRQPERGAKHNCKWAKPGSPDQLCGLEFEDAAQLQRHVEQSHIENLNKDTSLGCRWHGCDRKERPFAQKTKLKRHMYFHTDFYEAQCSVCDTRCRTKHLLEQHLRVHTKEKPFKCQECPSSFAVSSALTLHMRTHTGAKPHKCNFEGCTMTFSDSSNLTKHRKTHQPFGDHVCGVCKKTFKRKSGLDRHMHSQHLKNMQLSSEMALRQVETTE